MVEGGKGLVIFPLNPLIVLWRVAAQSYSQKALFGAHMFLLRSVFFAWEATYGKTLTLDQLKKRGWSLLNRCYLCGAAKESINHLLIHCTKARILWDLLSFWGAMGSSIVNERDSSWVAWIVCWQEAGEGLESSPLRPFLDDLEGKKQG